MSWRSCNNRTSNWPHQSHKISYGIPRTTNSLPALRPDFDHRTHASGVYSVTINSWWILHCWLTGHPIWDYPRGLHNIISERNWIILSDMNGHISRTTPYSISHQVKRFWINPRNTTRPCNLFMELKQVWENPTCEGRLICLEEHVSSLNICNPIQTAYGRKPSKVSIYYLAV